MIFFFNLFHQFITRDLRKNWLRTTLSVVGIAIGVSVFLAIILANQSALGKFRETVDIVAGKANLELTPSSNLMLDESLLQKLQWMWPTDTKFSPLINENVVLDGEERHLVQLIGIDMLADPDFKVYENAQQATTSDSEDTSSGGSNLEILAPDTVLIGKRLADTGHFHRGSLINLLAGEAPYTAKVIGVLSGRGLGGAFSGNVVVCDMGTAQRVLGKPGRISAIEIITPENEFKATEKRLNRELPKNVVVASPSARTNQVEKMTQSFEYNLLALSFIALMVGMFLIYNTITIAVIRRRTEIGTLRALGLSQRTVAALFFFEALWLGIVGSGLGTLAGVAMSRAALEAVSGTYRHFYFQNTLDAVQVHPVLVSLAFVLGVFLTVLAAIPPVWEATTVAPAEATRRLSFEAKAIAMSGKVLLIGLIFIGLGIYTWGLKPVYNFPVWGFFSSFCFIVGSSLTLPRILIGLLEPVAGILHDLVGPEASLAALSLKQTAARTSVAVASLMIGIAMMVSLAIMIGSFRQTVVAWVEQTLKADLFLQSTAKSEGSRNARLSPEIVAKIIKVPGVKAADGFVETQVNYQGTKIFLAAADLDIIGKYGNLHFQTPGTSREIIARTHEGSAVISECFASKFGYTAGDTITLPSPKGPVSLFVTGVYYDYTTDLGFVVMPRTFYCKNFDDNGLTSVSIYLNSGTDAEAVREAILDSLGVESKVVIRTTREIRREAMKIFDRTFSVTYALHTIAIIVAILSVMNSLFALTFELRREFAILRYIGASKEQMGRMVITQAAILGLLGDFFGVILGFVLSLLLIFVVNKQSFGWTVELNIPYDFLLESTALVFITGILSGVIPARMAQNTPLPEVVRGE